MPPRGVLEAELKGVVREGEMGAERLLITEDRDERFAHPCDSPQAVFLEAFDRNPRQREGR
jgi:hypothetical protein